MSYLAGIFDGEGCVSITKKKPRLEEIHSQYEVYLSVAMCDEAVPRFFQNVFGGSLQKRPIRDNRPRTRPIWQWSICSRKCLVIMKELLPYVLIKRPQLEVAIHLLEHRKSSHSNIDGKFIVTSDAELTLRQADYILCHNLKQRGGL